MCERKESCFLFAFLAGAAAGAVVTAFLASEKGKEFRAQFKDWAGEKMDESLDKMQGLKDSVGKQIKKKTKDLRKKMQDFKENLADAGQ